MYIAASCNYEPEYGIDTWVGKTEEEAFNKMLKHYEENEDYDGCVPLWERFPYEMEYYYLGRAGSKLTRITPFVVNESDLKKYQYAVSQQDKIKRAYLDRVISKEEHDRKIEALNITPFVPEWEWQEE